MSASARAAAGRRLDLSTGTPDPELLPPLGPALTRLAAHTPAAQTGTYLSSPLVEPLEVLLRQSWPFTPQRLTVVDGAVDAISRTLEQVAGFGDRVAVEDPGFPPIFDLLDQLGLERIPVGLDRQGMRPDDLAAALRAGASIVVLQPRAHNPTGVSLTAARARELAAVLRQHAAQSQGARVAGKGSGKGSGVGSGTRSAMGAGSGSGAGAGSGPGDGSRPGDGSGPGAGSWAGDGYASGARSGTASAGRVHVIEDDHSGEISSARDVSLGTHLPDQVVHVRSYSKSHGPDLRIAAVGGPAHVIDALVARRMLGPGWTSRLLQHVLVDLLTDGDAMAAVAQARRVYYGRQRALSAALAEHGIDVSPGDGINLWVPVRDEATALVRLEAAGIRVAPGSPFLAGPAPEGSPGHVRVTISALRGSVDAVARALVLAASA